MLKNRFIWPLIAVFLLTACEKEKIPLPGERRTVLAGPVRLTAEGSEKISLHLAPAIHNKDWPQAGYNTTHAIPHLKLHKNLHHTWTTNIGQGSSEEQRLIANVIAQGGHVYALDAGGHLSCIDLRTGQILWTRDTLPAEASADAMGGGLAYENGQIFASTSLGEVLAFDEQGQELWRQSVQTPIRTAPTTKDGRVFVTTVNSELFALDAKSGVALWNHAGIPENAGILGGASPAVKDNLVIAAYSSGEIFALNAQTGSVNWTDTISPASHMEALSAVPHIRARPIIKDDKLYIVSHGGRIVSYDLKTGARTWQQEVGGLRTPAIMGNYLVLVSNQDDLVCLNRHTGKTVWSTGLPRSSEKKNRLVWSGPLLAGKHLILTGSNGQILFIASQDGQVVKSLNVEGGSFLLSPIAVDGMLLTLGDNGDLVAWH